MESLKEMVGRALETHGSTEALMVRDPALYESLLDRLEGAQCVDLKASGQDAKHDTSDAIYLWQAIGETHMGADVFKVGVCQSKTYLDRPLRTIRLSPFEGRVLVCQKVSVPAVRIEQRILSMGEKPNYSGFDGCAEFRSFTTGELAKINQIIQRYAVQ